MMDWPRVWTRWRWVRASTGRVGVALGAGALAALCGAAGVASADWNTEATFQDPRPGLAAAVFGGRVYAAGGAGLLEPSASVDSFDPKTGDWRALTPLPEGRARFAMAAAGDRLYAAGGVTQTSAATSAFLAYDPALDEWTPMPDMPDARAGHAMVAVDNTLYVVGAAPVVTIYAPETNAWTTRAAPAATARRGAAAAALDGRIYVLGGRGADGAVSPRVDVYDPAADAWTRGPDLPGPRAGLGAAVLGGALHVFGGADLDGRGVSSAHFVLAADGQSWRDADALLSPRTDFGVAAVDGAIVVLGGGAGGGFLGPFTAVDAVDVFRR